LGVPLEYEGLVPEVPLGNVNFPPSSAWDLGLCNTTY
jgi:hypothetical protein